MPTIAEKILRKKAGKGEKVEAGEILECEVDYIMVNDITLSLIHISEPTRPY